MEVKIVVNNRDEQDNVNKILEFLKRSPDYKNMAEYSWRSAFVDGSRVVIDREVLPTELQEFELECECGKRTESECLSSCVRHEGNENGEDQENGNE